jgi:DHA2 family multidrug resistance protein
MTDTKIPLRTWIAFASMALGMFMAILDIQIVSSSLSNIQAGLSASSDEISWVQTSYLIAEVIMISFSGFLSRLLSTRILFLISAIGFTISSLLCALSFNINSMIIFRCLQGFLGGAMIPTVFSSVFILFPPQARTNVMVFVALIATIAPTIGPTLGGLITESLSWHWLFLMNLFPGILVSIMTWFFIDFDKADYSLFKGFDFIGLILMALFLGTLQYVIEEGNNVDWFSDPLIVNLTICAIIFASAFIWRSLTYNSPIVDLRAFADLNFVIGCFYSFILGIGLYGTTYLTPLFLGRIRNYTSLQIGEVMMVVGIFQMLSAPISGAISKKISTRLMMFIGLCLLFTGIYLNSFLTNQSGFAEFFAAQALRGLSLVMCFIPINKLALGTLPKHKLKNASGLYNLMRNLGGAIGLAGINNILNHRFDQHQQRLAEKITNSQIATQNYLSNLSAKFESLNMGEAQSLKIISNMVQKEALILSFNDVYLVITLILVFSLLLMPLVAEVKEESDTKLNQH